VSQKGPLTPHFDLSEFLPAGHDGSVPGEVLGNLIAVAELLEVPRAWLARPLKVTSGWRLPEHNAEVVGSRSSDHMKGRAADVQAGAGDGESWQDATIRLFHWARVNLAGRYGQLILEDRREHLKDDKKLCVHISIPTAKHPGDGKDVDAVLVSSVPGVYRAFEEPRA